MLQPCIFQEARVALGCASSNSYTLFCALLTSCILNISTLKHKLICEIMLEMIIYKRSGQRWRFDCNIHFMNVYSQKFHTNRNIANNIKFKIDESSEV